MGLIRGDTRRHTSAISKEERLGSKISVKVHAGISFSEETIVARLKKIECLSTPLGNNRDS